MVGATGLLRPLAALVEPRGAATAASPLRGSFRRNEVEKGRTSCESKRRPEAANPVAPPDTKKPTSQEKWVYFGRPTGMALRTVSNFLKMASNPRWSSGDAITKLEFTL